METRLHYDLSDKQLRFHVRQRMTTEQKLEFKAVGLMDPATASMSYRASLKQYATAGPALKDAAGTPLRLGGGLAVQCGSTAARPAATRGSPAAAAAASGGAGAAAAAARPLLTLSADKKVALLGERGPASRGLVLSLKAAADWDVSERRLASRTGLVRLAAQLPAVTARQDLRLAAGVAVEWPAGRQPVPTPFVQLRENNWAATVRGGRAVLTYDL